MSSPPWHYDLTHREGVSQGAPSFLFVMSRIIETVVAASYRAYAWLSAKARAIAEVVDRWWQRYKEQVERHCSHEGHIDEVLDSDVEYELEDVDVRLAQLLKADLERLEDGKLLEHIKSLTFEQRKNYFKSVLLPCVSKRVGVSVAFLGWLSGRTATAGYYNHNAKGITLNELFLATDNDYLLKFLINTVVHECRHAMQIDAVKGINTHGCSPELIEKWRRNIADYIRPGEDDEAYFKQIVEWDARLFAEKVYSPDIYSVNKKA